MLIRLCGSCQCPKAAVLFYSPTSSIEATLGMVFLRLAVLVGDMAFWFSLHWWLMITSIFYFNGHLEIPFCEKPIFPMLFLPFSCWFVRALYIWWTYGGIGAIYSPSGPTGHLHHTDVPGCIDYQVAFHSGHWTPVVASEFKVLASSWNRSEMKQ